MNLSEELQLDVNEELFLYIIIAKGMKNGPETFVYT